MGLVSIEEATRRYSEVFTEFEQLPADVVSKVYDGTKDRLWDLATPLKNGKAWLFDDLRKYQPRTYEVVMGGSEFRLLRRRYDGKEVQALVLVVGGEVVEVCRNFWGRNPGDPGYQDWISRVSANLTQKWGRPMTMEERHLSLPEPLRMSYYRLFDGLNLPRRVPWGIEFRLLPRPTRGWNSIDGYLKSLGLEKQLLPIVEEMIPGIRPAQKDMPFVNFMLFLDSRPTVAGTEGDVFFVKNHMQDGTIYYIRDADVANMMILADSVEAIDQYCEHVLIKREGRFDFRPFAKPFVSP